MEGHEGRMGSLNDNLDTVKFIDTSDCSNEDLVNAGVEDLKSRLSRNPFGKMSKF